MKEIIKKLEEKIKKELDKDGLPNAEILETIRVLIGYDMNKQLSKITESKNK